jgi:hypothetical protein
MTNEEISIALNELGFKTGWVVTGDEITYWTNTESKPTKSELAEAFKLYKYNQAAVQETNEKARTALLQRLGITEDEAKLLLA